MIVVADTGPIHYLVLCGCIESLRELYGTVVIPRAVVKELSHHSTPNQVKAWMAALPSWVSIRSPQSQSGFQNLGLGEREALLIAVELRADLVLIDETLARRLATESQLVVKGTLGVLEEAAEKVNLDLAAAIERLRKTGIYLDEKIIAGALERNRIRLERLSAQERGQQLERDL